MNLNVLIVEGEEPGMGYEVVGLVGSVQEAHEFAANDLRFRLQKLEADRDPGLCPYVYKMHALTQDGFRVAHEILATDL